MKYGPIVIDVEILGGTPVFSGTRVPVQTLFDYLEGGDSVGDFLNDYETVSKELVAKVLEMAKTSITTEKLLNENFIG